MAGSVADLSRDGTLHRDIADIFKGYPVLPMDLLGVYVLLTASTNAPK